MSDLPAVPHDPPDMLWAYDSLNTVAVSGWTGDRAIVLGNETMEEWLTFDGEVAQVLDQR